MSSHLIQLLKLGDSDGPSEREALELLRALRSTPEEGRALAGILQLARDSTLPESILVATAAALVDRGDHAAAISLLSTARGSSALLVSADLLAQSGDYPGALARIERILLRDFEFPGAKERLARWRTKLQIEVQPASKAAFYGEQTLITSRDSAPFVIAREVARGGSGTVYEATCRALGRTVALKLLHRIDREGKKALLHEARITVSLAAPHVVRLFDIDPNDSWIALQWAPLGSIRDQLRLGQVRALIPIETWIFPLVNALARIHAMGWVHNDIKPANVLLRSLNEPLLTDFATARRIGEASPEGSMGYVSPERLSNRAWMCAPTDDIYGFGRLLEDVLDSAESEELDIKWRPVVSACIGPHDTRLSNGDALRRHVHPMSAC